MTRLSAGGAAKPARSVWAVGCSVIVLGSLGPGVTTSEYQHHAADRDAVRRFTTLFRPRERRASPRRGPSASNPRVHELPPIARRQSRGWSVQRRRQPPSVMAGRTDRHATLRQGRRRGPDAVLHERQ
jgi:hypothetical protein